MVLVQSVPSTPWSLEATTLRSPWFEIASRVQEANGRYGLPLEMETMLLAHPVKFLVLVYSHISPRSV